MPTSNGQTSTKVPHTAWEALDVDPVIVSFRDLVSIVNTDLAIYTWLTDRYILPELPMIDSCQSLYSKVWYKAKQFEVTQYMYIYIRATHHNISVLLTYPTNLLLSARDTDPQLWSF